MDEDGLPRVMRQRFPGQPDKAARDAFAKDVVERARWYGSRDGRRIMTQKGYRPVAVASGLIQDVLDLAGEAGMSPLQVLEMALLNYSATQGFENPALEEVRAHLKAVLDKAGSDAPPDDPEPPTPERP